MAEEEEQLELKFRIFDGTYIGHRTYLASTNIATLKQRILSEWPQDKSMAAKSVNDMKLIHAGKFLDNGKTLAESRVHVGDLPGGVITMHVVVQPPVAKRKAGGPHIDSTTAAIFAEKAAKKKEKDAERKAARKAEAEQKTLAKMMAEEARVAAAARFEEDRLASEARGQPNFVRAVVENQVELVVLEESEDEVPLSLKRRRLTGPTGPTTDLEAQTSPLSSSPGPSGALPTSPQEARENIFVGSTSAVGVRMLKSLLSPDEESQLEDLDASAQFFEGANLYLSGVQMLISSFEEVNAIATEQERKQRSTQDLLDQVQSALTQSRELHNIEVAELRTRQEVIERQMEAALADLRQARTEVKVADVRADLLRISNKEAELRIRRLVEEVEFLKARETERSKSKEEWKASFLSSSEFQMAVTDKAFDYFEIGFEKCMEQVEEAGIFPEDKEDLISFDKAVGSLTVEKPKSQSKEDDADKPESKN